MSQIKGEEVMYHSSDKCAKHLQTAARNPMTFVISLKFPRIPNHELRLKVGQPVMLLGNINQSPALCNGTTIIINQLGNKYIKAKIITGT